MSKYEEYTDKLMSEVKHKPDHIRLGQHLMNTLHKIDKDAYNFITEKEYDCFYLDSKIQDFYNGLFIYCENN